MYLLKFKVWKLTELELQSIFYDYSKQEITFVESLFVMLLGADDFLKKLFCHGKDVMAVFIFRMSKGRRSELATFGRGTPLVAEAR